MIERFLVVRQQAEAMSSESAKKEEQLIMSQLDPTLCTHTNIIPGLDAIQCRDCRRTWWEWHKDFERLLANPSLV